MTPFPEPITPDDREKGPWHTVHRHGDDLCISGIGHATKEAALAAGSSNATTPCVGAISRGWFPHAEANVVELEAALKAATATQRPFSDKFAGEVIETQVATIKRLEKRVEAFANDLHYLRSILGHLNEVQKDRRHLIAEKGYMLGDEVLADNINWLDCFIELQERPAPSVEAMASPPNTEDARGG